MKTLLAALLLFLTGAAFSEEEDLKPLPPGIELVESVPLVATSMEPSAGPTKLCQASHLARSAFSK